MTRHLDAERLLLWRGLVGTGKRITAALEEAVREEHGVELAAYEVLDRLDRSGGSARMQDVADELLIKRSTFTRMIDRMDTAGLVTRELTAEDGRGLRLQLTVRGRRIHQRIRPLYRRIVRDHFAIHVTDSDVAALQRILRKLSDRAA